MPNFISEDDIEQGMVQRLQHLSGFDRLNCFPAGADSHNAILMDFCQEPDLGGKLSPEHILLLKKYLSFRHRFFHGYGCEVNWEIVSEPLENLPDIIDTITNLWDT